MLSDISKAKKMTETLGQLAIEYANSSDPAERKCCETVHRAMMDLPDYSKVRLYDILTKTN